MSTYVLGMALLRSLSKRCSMQRIPSDVMQTRLLQSVNVQLKI